MRSLLQRAIRPSRTQGVGRLWAKSLLNAALFFGVFMVALPWAAHRLLPIPVALPAAVQTWIAATLALAGLAIWIACLDAFSRLGGGTPLAADAPRHLVTTGIFSWLRNPLMVGELAVVWAEFLHFGSLGIGLYAAALTAAAHLLVVHIEEPELLARFGDGYTEYRSRVPRWVPRLATRGPGEGLEGRS
jgi:protein-S-isoprenylcysteine O-methyltransferase Ste14